MAELVPLVVLALAFVVLVILPMRARNRQLQKTRQLQDSLTPGTEVMTTSGLFGRIVVVADESVDLEIAPGTVVRWAKAAIAETRSSAEEAVAEEVAAEKATADRAVAEREPGQA
jgi:preprotein translocase subunit YajC